MADITRQQVSGACIDSRQENRPVLLGQLYAFYRSPFHRRVHGYPHIGEQFLEPCPVLDGAQVPASFLYRVGRAEYPHIRQTPEAPERRVRFVRRGEEYVGIQEQAIHGGAGYESG